MTGQGSRVGQVSQVGWAPAIRPPRLPDPPGSPDRPGPMLMRSGCEVPLFGSRRELRAIHADDDPPPGAVAAGVARGVAHGVLAGKLVGNLTVHLRQLGHLAGEKRPPTGLLRELAQRELRFLESLAFDRVARAKPNRVD